MNFRTRSFLVLLTMIVFTLISCSQNDGRSSSSSKSKRTLQESKTVSPVCDENGCHSSIDWRIFLNGKSFPAKVRLEIENSVVLDECLSKQRFSIKRLVTPQVVYLHNYSLPINDTLKIKVVDLGENCELEETFIYDESTPFEIKKNGSRHQLIVDL